ncbi:MAG: hypothetical protein R6U98_28655 [Pirellulaceae bacterium]
MTNDECSRSRVPLHGLDTQGPHGCHELVPWWFTLAATHGMPRACPVVVHARRYTRDATGLSRGGSRSLLHTGQTDHSCPSVAWNVTDHGTSPWHLHLEKPFLNTCNYLRPRGRRALHPTRVPGQGIDAGHRRPEIHARGLVSERTIAYWKAQSPRFTVDLCLLAGWLPCTV